ncbi:MAG: DNA translocase FtsK, partial [Chloroflexota bacterium]
ERIVGVLKWVTREMDARYKQFSEQGSRNIEDFNKHRDPATTDPMPYMVVIIDELADLMMLAPEETERTITRIAALARATGIHLVIATQRPSVDVVTGLIKANFPARIAFAVAGSVDSRVILDQPGAERLLGKGDMLYLSGDSPAPLRLQGVYVSDMEINNIVRYWKMQAIKQPAEDKLMRAELNLPRTNAGSSNTSRPSSSGGNGAFWDNNNDNSDLPLFASNNNASNGDSDDVELTRRELTGDVQDGNEDELYDKAVELVRRLDKASISLLQRRLRIGYTRSARLIDVMEARGVVGPAKDGSSKPRDVLPE